MRTSRLGAAELFECEWSSVVLRACKVTYLNLRAAKLADVLLEDCMIDELDLYGATCERVAIVGGQIGELTLRDAHLADVDLRAARIDCVASAASLKGATISVEQILDLGPQLA